MNILIVMIPLSMILMVGAAIAFFWAVEHDQFDDMDTPALLPLMDPPSSPQTAAQQTTASHSIAPSAYADPSEPRP